MHTLINAEQKYPSVFVFTNERLDSNGTHELFTSVKMEKQFWHTNKNTNSHTHIRIYILASLKCGLVCDNFKLPLHFGIVYMKDTSLTLNYI